MELNKIYNEPCLETLIRTPNEFIDCVITSPPYWQLRDYGYQGQWGLEPTYKEYLEHLWSMMDEIYRVLKRMGTVWINLGDTYSSNRWSNTASSTGISGNFADILTNKNISEPNKCLLLIPHRFAIGCIERGWIVRNDCIWAKRNGMPESVTDRFTKKHEYMFFMVKQEKYYFDLDSIRDKHKLSSMERYNYEFSGNKLDVDRKMIGQPKGKVNLNKTKYDTIDLELTHRQGMHKERGSEIIEKRPFLPPQEDFVRVLRENFSLDEIIEKTKLPKTKVEHWFRYDVSGFSYPTKEDWELLKTDLWKHELCTTIEETDDINKNAYRGKNCGDVSDFWDITTKGNKEKHYASYNDSLLVKPVLAGCPENGIIYDPFMGTGSTAEVAIRSKRKFIGSEMSTEYCKIAEKRLTPFLTQHKLF